MSGTGNDPYDCALCRMLRGLASGGVGAALGGLPAKWLGAPLKIVIYCALFGAFAFTLLFLRKRPPGGTGA